MIWRLRKGEGGREGGRGLTGKSSMSPSSPVACRSRREGRHGSAQVERGSGGGEGEESVTSAAGVRLEERDNGDRCVGLATSFYWATGLGARHPD